MGDVRQVRNGTINHSPDFSLSRARGCRQSPRCCRPQREVEWAALLPV